MVCGIRPGGRGLQLYGGMGWCVGSGLEDVVCMLQLAGAIKYLEETSFSWF